MKCRSLNIDRRIRLNWYEPELFTWKDLITTHEYLICYPLISQAWHQSRNSTARLHVFYKCMNFFRQQSRLCVRIRGEHNVVGSNEAQWKRVDGVVYFLTLQLLIPHPHFLYIVWRHIAYRFMRLCPQGCPLLDTYIT